MTVADKADFHENPAISFSPWLPPNPPARISCIRSDRPEA
jgi:hypothetical protein